jgi:GAF domain-containing protein
MQTRLDRAYREELTALLGQPDRLEAVYDTAFLAQELQSQLDQVMELTRNVLETPHAAVNLVYEREVVVLSGSGNVPSIEEFVAMSGAATAAEQTYCQHVVHAAAPVVIEDSLEHPLVRDSVWAQSVRSYLGVPLVIRGHVVGTICVTSPEPRSWNTAHIRLLAQCAALVQALIERRLDESPARADVASHSGEGETEARPDR